MRPSPIPPTVCFLAAIAALPASAAERAQMPAALAPAPAPSTFHAQNPLPTGIVLHDETEAGVLWARGDTFKASFDADAATYVPYFGSHAPRNFPVAFSLEHVTVGGAPLAFEAAKPRRVADRIVYERGTLVEAYDLAPRSLEQTFVFESLPNLGELVLDVAVASELERGESDAHLWLSNELGRVDVSRAIAIDAKGARLPLETGWSEDGLRIRVPAEFVASASFPLVVDPIVTTFTVIGTTTSAIFPDVAYAGAAQIACFVNEFVFSAVDHDVIATMTTVAGVPGGFATLDVTGADWRHPSVAFNVASGKFFAVAEVGVAPFRNILGRTLTTGALAGPVRTMNAPGADAHWPDIGGDYYSSAVSSRFCVVWQRTVSSVQSNIEARVLDPEGVAVTEQISIQTIPGVLCAHPAISKMITDTTWNIAWDRSAFGSDRSIFAMQLDFVGGFDTAPFAVNATAADDAYPSVSTSLNAGADAPEYLVAYQRFVGASDRDIVASVCRDLSPVVLGTYLLTPADPASQIAATVDSDGLQFFVGFMDAVAPGSTTNDIELRQYAWNGTTLATTWSESLAATADDEAWPQIVTDRSGAASGSCAFVTWQSESNGIADVLGARYCGVVGGPTFTFCPGDGSEGACPCANNGAPGHGCANSADAQGAVLYADGVHALSSDTTVLQVSNLPASTTCLFFQGTTSSTGTTFGDGRRCVTGTVIRLGTKVASSGNASYPGAGDVSVSVKGAVPVLGGRRYYQAWYRNAASYCLPATFNVSNGAIIDWTR